MPGMAMNYFPIHFRKIGLELHVILLQVLFNIMDRKIYQLQHSLNSIQ